MIHISSLNDTIEVIKQKPSKLRIKTADVVTMFSRRFFLLTVTAGGYIKEFTFPINWELRIREHLNYSGTDGKDGGDGSDGYGEEEGTAGESGGNGGDGGRGGRHGSGH